MQGKPWLRVLIALIAILFVSVPIWMLTNSSFSPSSKQEGQDHAMSIQTSNATVVRVDLSFVPPVKSFEIVADGKAIVVSPHSELQNGAAAETIKDWHGDLSLAVPLAGLDLALVVRWGDVTQVSSATSSSDEAFRGAARIVLHIPERTAETSESTPVVGMTMDRTFWVEGTNQLTELITVPGKSTSATH